MERERERERKWGRRKDILLQSWNAGEFLSCSTATLPKREHTSFFCAVIPSAMHVSDWNRVSGVLELQEALLLRMEHPRVIQSIGDLGTGAIEILVKKKKTKQQKKTHLGT